MVIHNLQILFSLLVAIVHKRDFTNILICAQIARLYATFSCMCAYVRFLRSDPFVYRDVDHMPTLLMWICKYYKCNQRFFSMLKTLGSVAK